MTDDLTYIPPENLTVITCGLPRDHTCDTEGPNLMGGENADGTFWEMEDTPENRKLRKRASWGSVSCSMCGRTAMETSMWRDG